MSKAHKYSISSASAKLTSLVRAIGISPAMAPTIGMKISRVEARKLCARIMAVTEDENPELTDVVILTGRPDLTITVLRNLKPPKKSL